MTPEPRPARHAGLAGRTVALLEARRASELADLVRRYGGEPWSVPSMREVPLEADAGSAAALRELCAGGADTVICLTGVGTRALFKLAAELGLEAQLRQALQRAHVVVRGPKPQAALRELGVRIDRAASSPHTSRQVLEALADVPLGRVAVQLYGGPDPELRTGLEARGASVLEIPLYRWALPHDVGPMLDFVDHAAEVDALAVTSATQVHNLFAVAQAHGREPALRAGLRRLTIAAVGPVAALALAEHGVAVAVQPQHPSMGAMVRDLADHFLHNADAAAHGRRGKKEEPACPTV